MRRGRSTVGVPLAVAAVGLAAGLVASQPARAHCDALDGPVVNEARAALEKGDVTPLLKWVTREHEPAIEAAFDRTLAVRAEGPQARELADAYFFETLVRIHRAGEGAPYTGLKPAGQIAPPIAAADEAIAAGSVDGLARGIARAAEQGTRERFERLMEARKHEDESVEAGREYVAAYAGFVHYVEGLHDRIASGVEHAHDAGHDEAPAHAD